MTSVRVFDSRDSKQVLALVSDIIVNEFGFKLELDGLDSDLLQVEEHYNKDGGGCFWVAEIGGQIVGTAGVRKLEQFQSTCELKRMYVARRHRKTGIAQKMPDVALEFAKSAGYARMVLDSSRHLQPARALYLKNGFADIGRYNDNHRADVFMERALRSTSLP